MRAFPVCLPTGVRYWTVLDDGLEVHGPADRFLQHVRFGMGRAESTTQAYATGVALYLVCGAKGPGATGGSRWRASAALWCG